MLLLGVYIISEYSLQGSSIARKRFVFAYISTFLEIVTSRTCSELFKFTNCGRSRHLVTFVTNSWS